MTDNTTTDNRRLLVIKASAGSGKTYRLALEYIKHLLFTSSGAQLVPRRGAGDGRLLNVHRQLLAITFTNKATDEMKQRIVKELYRLSRPGVKSDYLQGFMQESGLAEGAVRALARQALNELLFDYSNFNVSTIDSFFQTILRNFARELDRDFNYDIQLEEDYAVRVAVHNFLLSLGKEGKPTQVDQWVQEYQRHLLRGDVEKKNWKFFDDGGRLNKFARNINSELFRSRMKAIRDYLGHLDDEGRFVCDFGQIRAFKKLMHEMVQRCDDNIQEGYAQLRDILTPLGPKGSFKNWLAKGGNTPFDLSKTWKEITEAKVVGQFYKSNIPDQATIERVLALMLDHRNQRLLTDFFQHIEDNLGLLGLLAMIDLFLEEYRHETNSILIGDTNELIGTVLESGTDFIYERVGTMIENFMIDEFQDTSTKQYENFRGLLRESLASGHFNMLIGDAKQSIYRFRNADLTVFRELVGEDFASNITDGRQNKDADGPSSVNYRSSRHIIEFNNALFEFLKDRYGDRPTVVDTYGDIEQGMPGNIDSDKLPGYVRLIAANRKALLQDEVVAGAMAAGDGPTGEGDVAVEAVLPGYLLRLHKRYDWGRIGILVNSHSDGDKVVECILDYNKRTTGEKIHIISGESLLLSNSPIIRRIIAMLRYIDISQFSAADEDDIDDTAANQDSLWHRLRSKRLSDQRLYTALNDFIQAVAARPDAAPLDNGHVLVECLEALKDGAQGGADGEPGEPVNTTTLEHLLPPAGELTTLVSIVETIIAHFKRGANGGTDVDREVAFLLAFQDTVMQFSAQRNGGSVREFLKFWDEKKNKLAVSSADGGDAINIMTIHAAKGLEFDCVVIPFADWEMDGNKMEKDYWMPREAFADVMDAMLPDGQQCPGDMVPPLLHVGKTAAVELCRAGAFGGEAAAFINKQIDDVLIDNMNKTYVAMTRPRTELHIFADGDSNTIAPLLTEFADAGGKMAPVGDVEGWYESGTLSTAAEMAALREKKAKQAADDTEPPVERVSIGGYTVNALPVELRVRVEHASSTSIDAGLRLHGLLSRMRDRNDVDRVIDSGLKHGVITTGDPDDPCGIECINAHVRGPILDPVSLVYSWFDPANKVYSERTITAASTDLFAVDGIENVRPDRVVLLPDGQMLVIDYKSGERDDKRYLAKLNQYMSKLRLIFPGTPVAGRLWYVTRDLILDEKGKRL
ncbi:MAG: UvrD-helicase domain-containing protein [Muribaculaceae bacterium]|nr:UvrD-helicase domain-containing protein [Muribaculaceae bacterium]